MKVEPECNICLLERALKISDFLGISKEKRFALLRSLMAHFQENLDEESVPAVIGTARERIIQEELGLDDPYEKIKRKSHEIGKNVAKEIETEVDLSKHTYRQFHTLLIYAVQANAMEWFIRGHEPDLEHFLQLLRRGKDQLELDASRDLWERIKDAERILYLLDNSGESEIDFLVIKFLKEMGKELFIGAKSAPILNDITLKEARSLGFGELGELIPTGQYVGTLLDERATPELLDAFRKADVVIAKGMGSYEALSEYESKITPLFIGMKAKCKAVANHVGVSQGDLIIKRIF